MVETLASGVGDREAFLFRYLRGPRFSGLYSEVMGIVERSAVYLDGHGRDYARTLDRHLVPEYSRTAMWLTVGLMRLASVVLVLKSVGSGEMSFNHAVMEIKKSDIKRPHDHDHLPKAGISGPLLALLEDFRVARDKVERLTDRVLEPAPQKENQALEWLSLLEREFGARRVPAV